MVSAPGNSLPRSLFPITSLLPSDCFRFLSAVSSAGAGVPSQLAQSMLLPGTRKSVRLPGCSQRSSRTLSVAAATLRANMKPRRWSPTPTKPGASAIKYLAPAVPFVVACHCSYWDSHAGQRDLSQASDSRLLARVVGNAASISSMSVRSGDNGRHRRRWSDELHDICCRCDVGCFCCRWVAVRVGVKSQNDIAREVECWTPEGRRAGKEDI